ncbi:MAG: pyridoxal phosphate-dependent aminotransferase [Myxococcales bacterium FL481]|nr:MAG: pyridoxal phosphate-dependent aminotransferase [Myxococcales bacterium FL481]
MFSRRTDWGHDVAPSHAGPRLRGAGDDPPADLTVANPTRLGFEAPGRLLRFLAEVDARHYSPCSAGVPQARAAVAEYHRGRGGLCEPDQVWLTASTSEAYAQLLAVTCDPGDAVLVPSPGYPLFDFLADVAGVHVERYGLEYDGTWFMPRSSVESAWQRCRGVGRRVGAVIAVAPSNPLGCYLRRDELDALRALCIDADITLVVDEVFADYPVMPASSYVPTAVDQAAGLTVVLSGLSKVAALPQLKLAWGVATGDDSRVQALMHRLTRVSDLFLSVATPVQLALPQILEHLPAVQAEIRQRLRANYRVAIDRMAHAPISVLPCEGGWSMLLRLPQVHDGLDRLAPTVNSDFAWATVLWQSAGVVVQPAALYGLAGPYVVVSLLTEPSRWQTGLDRLARLL